jgi:hypothetical protein
MLNDDKEQKFSRGNYIKEFSIYINQNQDFPQFSGAKRQQNSEGISKNH